MEYRPIARSSEIVVQQVGDETLIYDTKSHKAKCLNETSAMIWKLCDGKKTAMEITMALSAELKTKVDEELVWLAFDQLQKEELLEGENFLSRFEGTSRRDVIKKVGFAAVIALPIVSSVVAPTAAHAASVPACTAGSPLACECAGTGGNGTPACVAAFNEAGYKSTRAGNGPCTTNDLSCVSTSSNKCTFPAFPNQDKCCEVLFAPGCNNGNGGECCKIPSPS